MSEVTDKAVKRVKDIAAHFRDEIRDGDFHGNVQYFHKDGKIRAVMFPDIQDDNRAELTWAMKVLSSTMIDVGEIVAVNDAYHATSPSKVDGSKWEAGDMAFAFENKTLDAAFIRECLTYTIVNEDSVSMVSLPYDRTSNGDVYYDWNGMIILSTDEGEMSTGGALVDALREAFEAPKLKDKMEEMGVSGDTFGLDPNIVEVAMLCAGVKMILNVTDGRFKVMISALTDQEKVYINDSFAEEGYDIYGDEDVEG